MDVTDKLNMTMLCDFYELTMGNGYFEAGLQNRITYFDVFFREIPDHGGYAICAGLDRIIDYILDLHFSEEDIAYLRSKGLFSEAFLSYLRNFHFTGDIWAIPEGTPIFPQEPVITVRAPAIQAQLVETFLLLIFNHQSLVATKANRIVRAAEGRVVLDDLRLTKEYIQGVSRIFIVACGSSYHVGMVSKYNWERLLRRPVEVCLASEFRYCDPLVDDHSLVIFISQSGETLDTMAALREAKRRGGRTLAVVNVVGSSIAREADDVLYTWAGPEIAVATTKAYSTQLVLMDLIALYLGDLLGTIEKTEYDTILHELEVLPEKLERVLASIEDVKYFASRYFNHDSIFFIGRNLDYAMGLEGSLKLKEISYIHSEAYASGELKHGTISLIEPGTLVVALGTYEPLFDKAMSNVVEVKARGAEVLALATEPFKEKMAHTADSVIAVPETHPVVQPSLGVVPLQLFAYYVALQRGCDIDKPRNLAKSVTVE